MTFSDRVLKYYGNLNVKGTIPDGIQVMNPYMQDDVMAICKEFYNKYYNDEKGRRIIIGINPGRHGAGITGIPFTDPVALQEQCGIENSFPKRKELSSEFIYMLINRMGGPDQFYKHYFIGSVSSLGFVKDGKNFNYYDTNSFYRFIKPTLISNLIDQIGLGIVSRKCYCLGQGKNYEFMNMLNAELNLFDSIIPLPHPRWVMQYRRKKVNEIINQIIDKLIY